MKYELPNPRTLVITQNDSDAPETFRIPDKISTWQVIQFSAILADFMDVGSEAGAAIVRAIIAVVQTGFDMQKAARTLNDYDAIKGDGALGFVDMLSKGSRDVLRFLAEKRILAKLYAILYLRPNESVVKDLDARIDLFEGAPIEGLIGAVKDFLAKKIAQSKNTNSVSAIFETLKNLVSLKKQKTDSEEVSVSSSVASDGTVVSLMPSPTETLVENPESSAAPSSGTPSD